MKKLTNILPFLRPQGSDERLAPITNVFDASETLRTIGSVASIESCLSVVLPLGKGRNSHHSPILSNGPVGNDDLLFC